MAAATVTARVAAHDPSPPGLVRLEEWHELALCRGRHDLFFGPLREYKDDREARERKAKAICASCPVTVQCLDHALAFNEPFGVWGAMGPGERRRLNVDTEPRFA